MIPFILFLNKKLNSYMYNIYFNGINIQILIIKLCLNLYNHQEKKHENIFYLLEFINKRPDH